MDGATLRRDGAVTTAVAAAKLNLALHVTGRRADGYHDLESLVVFAGEGDVLALSDAPADRLTASGPFAHDLPTGRSNIVLRALDKARDVARRYGRAIGPLHLHLEKNLPHASGIGGGSADAAALIRLLCAEMPALAADLRREALGLGADVPMCVDGFPACVRGVGELSERIAALPDLAMLLVNPGVPVPTPAAFAGLERRDNASLEPVPAAGFATLGALLDYLARTRNDLEAPALRIAPVIGEASAAALGAGARFARMSGSGATVFGLFDDMESAREAAAALARTHPGWWIRATACPGAGGPA